MTTYRQKLFSPTYFKVILTQLDQNKDTMSKEELASLIEFKAKVSKLYWSILELSISGNNWKGSSIYWKNFKENLDIAISNYVKKQPVTNLQSLQDTFKYLKTGFEQRQNIRIFQSSLFILNGIAGILFCAASLAVFTFLAAGPIGLSALLIFGLAAMAVCMITFSIVTLCQTYIEVRSFKGKQFDEIEDVLILLGATLDDSPVHSGVIETEDAEIYGELSIER